MRPGDIEFVVSPSTYSKEKDTGYANEKYWDLEKIYVRGDRIILIEDVKNSIMYNYY